MYMKFVLEGQIPSAIRSDVQNKHRYFSLGKFHHKNDLFIWQKH